MSAPKDRMNFWQFITQKSGVGRTPWVPALGILLGSLLLIIAGLTGDLHWTGALMGGMIQVIFWYGTWGNYTGKRV